MANIGKPEREYELDPGEEQPIELPESEPVQEPVKVPEETPAGA